MPAQPTQPVPTHKRKTSKQLLEEKQIKRYLRAKKRSRNSRGGYKKESGADREDENETKVSSSEGNFERETKESSEGGERGEGRWCQYKISTTVTTERRLTCVKVPVTFLENKKLYSRFSGE